MDRPPPPEGPPKNQLFLEETNRDGKITEDGGTTGMAHTSPIQPPMVVTTAADTTTSSSATDNWQSTVQQQEQQQQEQQPVFGHDTTTNETAVVPPTTMAPTTTANPFSPPPAPPTFFLGQKSPPTSTSRLGQRSLPLSSKQQESTVQQDSIWARPQQQQPPLAKEEGKMVAAPPPPQVPPRPMEPQGVAPVVASPAAVAASLPTKQQQQQEPPSPPMQQQQQQPERVAEMGQQQQPMDVQPPPPVLQQQQQQQQQGHRPAPSSEPLRSVSGPPLGHELPRHPPGPPNMGLSQSQQMEQALQREQAFRQREQQEQQALHHQEQMRQQQQQQEHLAHLRHQEQRMQQRDHMAAHHPTMHEADAMERRQHMQQHHQMQQQRQMVQQQHQMVSHQPPQTLGQQMHQRHLLHQQQLAEQQMHGPQQQQGFGGGHLLASPNNLEPPGMRELKVEDALLYLDEVKREFKDRPTIYNEFLAIMKNFKSQAVDTPGVIDRVSRLFRGYNNLILGFNTFLPEGYKISLADLERAEAARLAAEAKVSGSVKKPGPKKGPKPGARNKGQQQQQVHMRSPQQQQGGFMGGRAANQMGIQGSGSSPPNQQWGSPDGKPRPNPFAPGSQPPPQHQAVEFDHAISYVTTIKKRFSSEPTIYHQFLEILHTYQKEQRGIKEVLEQVAALFADHPDLLREFTFFLPDAVQEQAKERLQRAAAESETRLALRQQQMDAYGMRTAQQQKQFIDMTRSQMGLSESDRGKKRAADVLPLGQADSYVYNSAVERQFFDATREALSSFSRDGGQAWAEFLKCLDMYAQEILSRTEMLNFVEPLLGKRTDLLEEFKRILAAAGAPNGTTPALEDAWYSVPLADIDFSRCRRCTPSYRALPRDYPDHPTSGRNEQEAKVLNDTWVSLPVGSEDSYTFRHMRRNVHEETLFRIEDERFEIDMVIDANRTTMQRLEPIAEEIALLSRDEMDAVDLGGKAATDGSEWNGIRYKYSFDQSILRVTHRNAINRVYGDSGPEIISLLIKNPVATVPIVVERLRQKDVEWRAVRDRLNRHWKEVAEHNYYKSLDHLSLTWRTVDKRAVSTRTLLGEIKDRAAHGGRESKEAYRLKLEKAKEEHGSFYGVTVGDRLSQDLDLTFLPKPERRLFTPHLAIMYQNVSWAYRDAYRILAFALERGPVSPADKERCHRLWIEFLGPWFNLSLNWMQKPAVAYQESSAAGADKSRSAVVSEDDDDSMGGEDPELLAHNNMVTENFSSEEKQLEDHHPLPAGAQVSTLYGEGKIMDFRRADNMYVVQLNFGAVGFLRPSAVLCSLLPVEKSAYTRQLRADDRTKLARPNDQLAFGTQSLYLFFRLHQILVNRLNTARRLAFSVGEDPCYQTMVEQMPHVNPKAAGRRRYDAFISLVYSLVDGGIGSDSGKYEDRLRSLLGNGAYELATFDKLISHIWKDIQAMANDETMWNLVQLYRRHMLAGSFQPEAFRQEAAYLSDGEQLYAFQFCQIPSSDESVLYMEYLGVMDDDDDEVGHTDDVNIPNVEIDPVEGSNKRQKR